LNEEKKNYNFILLFIGILIVGLCIILLIIFSIPILCEGDNDKFLETIKQSGEKINTTISNNNIKNTVENPNINIQNPDINIPSSVGTAVGKAASSFGIGVTAVAGMRAMSHKSNNLPPVTRAILLGTGGIIGTGIFILSNRINRAVQNTVKPPKNSNNNGPFSANSIIEEGDSLESVMNFLYFNLFISICILLLIILLIYLFKKDKSK
jgi:hypothetical protein